jgi:protein O-mannosyl-transferase
MKHQTTYKKKNKPEKSSLLGRNKSYIYMFFLVLVPLILYFRVIYFNFSTYDDTAIISSNISIIKHLENIPKAFTTDGFLTNKNSFYRPLQTLSFMTDAQVSGEEPWAYHLTNIILFILSVIVLFIFLKKVKIKEEIAFILSLFFSIHPMLTMAVCWIPARGDLFLTLFGLLSFVTFINYFNDHKNKFLVLHSICFLLLCLSKETGLVLPVLMLAYFYLIVKKNISLKEIIPFIIIWACVFIIYFILRLNAIKVTDPPFISGIIPFLKNLPAIPITLGKIFIPQGLTTMPLFNYLSAIVGIAVFILFIFLIIKSGIGKNAFVIFGALWFVSFTLPPMIFRLPIAALEAEYFEHRAILPLIGIIIIIGILFDVLFSKIGIKRIFIFSFPVIILFSILTWNHCNDFTDSFDFFTSAINSNSHNAVALNSRASIFINNGNFDQSVQDLDNAIKIYPNYSSPYFNKGNLYRKMNDPRQSEYFYSQSVKYDTLYPEINYPPTDYAYVNLSIEKVNQHKYDEALVLLKKAVRIDPGDSKIYNNIGIIYSTKAQFDSAVHAYSKAIQLEPNSALYLNNRGRAKYSLRNYADALDDFNKAAKLSPDYPETYYYLGATKLNMNDFDGAISELSTAIKLKSDYGAAYYYRGIAYSKKNKQIEAEEDKNKASSFGFR